MLADELRVPVALDARGEKVRPSAAPLDGEYRCPGCLSRVYLRQSERNQAHFFHDPGVRCGGPGEGDAHRAAKARIVAQIRDGQPVMAQETCRNCGGLVQRSLPAHNAAEEVTLASGRRVDVGLYDEANTLIAAIEILFSHEVDQAKAHALRRLPWCEVRALDVFGGDGEMPLILPLVQSGGGWRAPARCRRCTRGAFLPEVPRIPGYTRYDTGRQGAWCPKGGKPVSILYTCCACPFFIEHAEHNGQDGIWCGIGAASPSAVRGRAVQGTWPVHWIS